MKKIKLLFTLPLLVMLISCGNSNEDTKNESGNSNEENKNESGYSNEEIKKESLPTVIESICETADISEELIEVLDYTLIQETNSKYSGILETSYDDLTQTIKVIVLWDHSTGEYTVEWEVLTEK